MSNLRNLSKDDLLSIWNNLNNFEWDSRIGDKPLGFDEMPNRDRKSLFCKYKTISPYMDEITHLTTEKERLKYHHLNNLDRSPAQFEWWWIKRRFRTKILRQSF